jgi:hypothetical protein
MRLIPPRRLDLGNGHYMVTTAEFDPASRVVTFTEVMTCTNKFSGFTGGVLLSYLDSNNKVIGNSGVQQNGLGQAPLIGASHRPISWNGLAPEGTDGMLLAQFWDPHDRIGGAFEDIGNAFLAFAETTLEVALGLPIENAWSHRWCQSNPNWCSAIDVVGVIAGIAADVLIFLIENG